MIYPPLQHYVKAPRGFRSLVSAANGMLSRAKWILDYAGVMCEKIVDEKEKAKFISNLISKKGLGLNDFLYYTRLLEAYGVINASYKYEPPRRLSDLSLEPTMLAEIVSRSLKGARICGIVAMYMGLLFNTPARYTLIQAFKSKNMRELALSSEYRGKSLFTNMLAIQLEYQYKKLELEGKQPVAWYEPISDISGILLLASILQLVVGKKSKNRVVEPRVLNRFDVFKAIPEYSDYVLTRMSLLEVMDYYLNSKSLLEESGLKPLVGNVGLDWLYRKMPKHVASSYVSTLEELKKVKDAIKKYFDTIFSS